MATNVVKNDDQTVTIEVTVDGDVWKAAREAAFEKIRKNLNMKGFRKGHVPAQMARKIIHSDLVNSEAASDVAQSALESGLEETKVEFVDRPMLDFKDLDKDKAVLTFTAPVYPEVKLGKTTGFGIAKEEVVVTDEEVNDQVNSLLKNKGEWVVTEEPAKNGDQVTIDYVGKLDGEPFEGGSAEDQEVVLGSGRFIPGFEEQIEGMKAGETKDIEVTFPENYPEASLAGKPVVFTITVKEVSADELPELNDEFVEEQKIEDVHTVDELKDYIRKNLTARKEEQAENKFSEEVTKAAVAEAEADIPSVMIDREVDSMFNQLSNQVAQSGLDPETYFKLVGQNSEEIKENMRPQAEERIKNTLVLDAIAKAEDLTVADEDIDKELQLFADMYSLPLEQITRMISRDAVKEDLLREAAVKFLENNQ